MLTVVGGRPVYAAEEFSKLAVRKDDMLDAVLAETDRLDLASWDCRRSDEQRRNGLPA